MMPLAKCTYKEIQQLYDAAMSCGLKHQKNKYQLFYAWLSFYKKQMDRVQIRTIVPKDGKFDLAEKIRKVLEDSCELKEYEEYTEQALTYAGIAENMWAEDVYFLKLYAFAARDSLLWELVELKRELPGKMQKDVLIWKYMRFQDMVKEIEVIKEITKDYKNPDKPDSYTAELIQDYKAISDYVKKMVCGLVEEEEREKNEK